MEEELVFDIRNGGSSTGLTEQILIGLRGRPRSLPSLLLWDAPGLKLFNELSRDTVYYPAKKEADLLRSNSYSIATRIAPASAVIELGSGNLSKTASLLKALIDQNKSFQYFALDVSKSELRSSLARLVEELPGTAHAIRGLCGTYEDLVWALNNSLHHLRSSNLTFLWFGNSLANAPGAESFGLLKSLLNNDQRGPKAQAIVAVDGCQERNQVLKAYGSGLSVHRDFLMNGLVHANKILDCETFIRGDWSIATAFDTSMGLLTQDYVAQKHVEMVVGHEQFNIRSGEHVNICQSGKWDNAKVAWLARLAGMLILKQWQHEDGDYAMYLLGKEQY